MRGLFSLLAYKLNKLQSFLLATWLRLILLVIIFNSVVFIFKSMSVRKKSGKMLRGEINMCQDQNIISFFSRNWLKVKGSIKPQNTFNTSFSLTIFLLMYS